MIILDKGIIKEGEEYEDNGKNFFPLDLLTEEEKRELGLLKQGCCGSENSTSKCCKSSSGCSKGKHGSCCNK